MRRVKIIYNPSSGRQITQRRIDYLCNLLINEGYIVGKFNTEKKDDAMYETIRTCQEDWDAIIVCGGDGTINEVAKGIVKGNRIIPVGILSTGTVNDFANYMGLPRNIDVFFKMIKNGKTINVDLGKVNDEYFINVAASGLLTNIGYKVSSEIKSIFGRMAYYMEGLREIPKNKFRTIRIQFKSKEYTKEDDVLLFLISNTASIGGFKKIAPDAEVTDGYLDVIVIKKSEVQDLAQIFINIFKGEHINHPNVVYFKTKEISVQTVDSEDITIDVDGEYGGKLPAVYKVLPKNFEIFVP
ncbi:YegS/Rv2252/BmrU family lipid kinase [Schnuerera sp. xch1]|uniref:YegS/Rv2252/BmrU family lipid kinase n=1 Tax=Schnuerera sp. xch1 TaxID=2874283 RepID=UPI001CBDF993|nr:YegS/Rv2252/BmrU family lipid kinase [Schnuerera sp. xch1]MBZ2174105.1 YegS/Rv2252/BmrU family lipid kinase [Schnuerera sp. xch1]